MEVQMQQNILDDGFIFEQFRIVSLKSHLESLLLLKHEGNFNYSCEETCFPLVYPILVLHLNLREPVAFLEHLSRKFFDFCVVD